MNIINIIKSAKCEMCKIKSCKAKEGNLINLNNPFLKSDIRKSFLKMGFKDKEIEDMYKMFNLSFFIET